jgi:predicted GNAT family N-acyltransferase
MNSDTSRTLTSIADQICTWIASGRTNVLLDKALCETLFQGFSHPIHGDRLASNKLLTQILNLRKRGFQDSVSEPTPRMLNLILKAYCSNKKGEQKYVTSLGAHRFLKQLINKYEKKDLSVLPDRVGINNVIHCWSGTRHNQAVENAEYLFRLMKRLSIDHPQLSPDKFTYTSLLSVFSRNNYLANIAPRAQKWFDSFDRIDVDQATYNALLTVWSKSSKAEKVKRSREILDSMKKGRISGVDSYNIVINTCASSQENKSDALIAATDTFRELLTSYTPNAWSFIAMSRAIHNLSSNTDEKIQLSRVLFSQACRYGLFSEQLMKEILFSVKDDEARKEIFESHDPLKPYKDLPKHWKQNVTLGM